MRLDNHFKKRVLVLIKHKRNVNKVLTFLKTNLYKRHAHYGISGLLYRLVANEAYQKGL